RQPVCVLGLAAEILAFNCRDKCLPLNCDNSRKEQPSWVITARIWLTLAYLPLSASSKARDKNSLVDIAATLVGPFGFLHVLVASMLTAGGRMNSVNASRHR